MAYAIASVLIISGLITFGVGWHNNARQAYNVLTGQN